MLSITSTQLDAWLVAFIFPLSRILGLLSAAPVFSNAALPMRLRLIVGLAIAMAVVPVIPPMPAVSAGSWTGILILINQTLIGVLMGFTLRLALAAIDVAGELIGLQMGLSFAVFYDPQTAGQTPVVTEFLTLLSMLIFLAMNAHLLALSVLVESFTLLPVVSTPFATSGLTPLMAWASTLFATGLLLALPMIAALLIVNVAMGVLARVAPQLNLFAVGFPVTITAGFVVLLLSMPYFGAALERLFDQSFSALRMVMQASG
ncbi:MAG: flagellar biosynthetic protein FliR [Rhodocyclaceae bacterium]|nr:flagellar biosynthetic protein FliR [Rhodocyclaceae bacterium]